MYQLRELKILGARSLHENFLLSSKKLKFSSFSRQANKRIDFQVMNPKPNTNHHDFDSQVTALLTKIKLLMGGNPD